MQKKLSCLLFFLAVFIGSTQLALSLVNEHSSTQEVCDEIFANLYEFNYSCQPPTPYEPYSVEKFCRELPLCGRPIITSESFFALTRQTMDIMKGVLSDPRAQWLGGQPVTDLIRAQFEAAYGQALIVNPDIKIVVMGDYHGNAHSFARNTRHLQYLNLADEHGNLRPNVIELDLGDLGDRGHYSTETWSLAMAAKQQNPGRFFMLQGNHETEDVFSSYGFKQELVAKFFPGHEEECTSMCDATLITLFQYLPQIFFIGARASNGEVVFVQYNHAGIGQQGDPQAPQNIDIKPLLQYAVHNQPGTMCYQILPGAPAKNGLTWNGFYADPSPEAPLIVAGKRGCGDLIFHGRATNNYLGAISEPGHFRVDAIARGRDHIPWGINQLNYDPAPGTTCPAWDHWSPVATPSVMQFRSEAEGFPVYTFTSAPDGYGYDSFAVITFDAEHGQWTLTPYVATTPHGTDTTQKRFRWKMRPTPETQDFAVSEDLPIPE